jgi:hypothetical protein
MQLQSFVTELSRRRCPPETRCFLKQQKTQRVDWLKTEARFQSDGTISHQSSTVLAWCGNTKAQAGEGFYEEPGAHHRVQRKRQRDEPASLLAVFVVDADEQPLTIPDWNSDKR